MNLSACCPRLASSLLCPILSAPTSMMVLPFYPQTRGQLGSLTYRRTPGRISSNLLDLKLQVIVLAYILYVQRVMKMILMREK